MKTLTLKLDQLRVDTFATATLPHEREPAPGYLNTRTQWPKDCPETLPQFCH